MRKCNKRLTVLGSALAVPFLASSALGNIYHQDFSTDTDGVLERQFDSDNVSNVNRTASGDGNLGVSSHSAGFHLELGLINENDQTGFGYGASVNDGIQSGPFQSGMGMNFNAYIDNPARQLDGGGNAYEEGDGWFVQPTLQRPGGTPAISGGGFGAQLTDTGEWVFAATGYALGGFDYGLHFSAHDDHDNTTFALGETFSTSTEGWYEFETIWVENLDGGIDQINTIYDPNEVPVYIATTENVVEDVADAGTIGTIWFGQGGPREPNETGYSGTLVQQSMMGDLAIDNITVVPEPATVASWIGLVSIAAVFFIRRRRRNATS